MPGCSAFNCTNSAAKGFLMKTFPRDPARRKLWTVEVRRENWQPTNFSALCEVHFAEDMWEKTRVDGKRKLKQNAVPTLFSFSSAPVHREPAKEHVVPVIPEPGTADELLPMQIQETQEPPTSIASLNQSKSTADTLSAESSLDESGKKDRKTLQEKLQAYNHKYSFLLKSNRVYKNKLRNYKIKVKKQQKEIEFLRQKSGQQHSDTNLLQSILKPDQINALKRKSTRGMKWSNATIKTALKLKFSCGNSGYEEILKQNIPLPCVRTLQRHLETLKFESGILHEVFEFLKIKVSLFKKDQEKDCVLVLDEMAITPTKVYDPSTSSFIGDVTLPNHSGVATHALVIMLVGVSTCWKQTVAYFFTGDSVNGAVYEDILFEVIEKSENLGLKIVSITSDMGSSNQALWRKWNIAAGRYGKASNSITHPLDASRRINILADAPHLFKNIKKMFITNSIIEIPERIQEKYSLPTNFIKAEHVNDLITYQKPLKRKLAPKLTEEDMLPSHYEKMRASKSTHVISHEVSSGLKFIAQELNKPEYLTTAWFIEITAKWFSLVTSLHPSMALKKLNSELYKERMNFLNDFMEIYQTMKVGPRSYWKTSQTGVLVTTQSLIDLQKVFLVDKNYVFLLTSRFTQDCLENLFSVLCSKQLIPTAVQFKNNLKLMCVSQYLKNVSKGSYEQDDFLSDF